MAAGEDDGLELALVLGGSQQQGMHVVRGRPAARLQHAQEPGGQQGSWVRPRVRPRVIILKLPGLGPKQSTACRQHP
jgi:hypothetical protein